MEKTDFHAHIKAYIQKNALIKAGDHVLVGVSGGPDSVCLLRVLSDLAPILHITVSAAHVDHEWRAESADDALFCKKLCAELQISFYQTKLSAISCPTKSNDSKESYARTKRRFYFKNLAEQINAHSVALAHHKDDQMETFFIRLMRGSSLQGLSAMRPHDDIFIRPLLDTAKEDILAYLATHDYPYQTDASNDSDAFLRNRIRKYLIPAFLGSDPRNRTTFFSTLNTLQEENDALNQYTKSFLELTEDHESIPLTPFCNLPLALKKRVLIAWLCRNNIPFTPSQAFLHEIIRFIEKSSKNTHKINSFFKIRKYKTNIILEPIL